MPKPVRPRDRAHRDVNEAIDYYLREGSEKAALGFVEALRHAYLQISRHPQLGATRYAHELDLPGLRHRVLKRYPYLVFYVERENHIDVWRVLHGRRDIPTSMQVEEDS
jgi:toxin ParE1/3/4